MLLLLLLLREKMSRSIGPDLQILMDKRVKVYLNGGRQVTGILAGFDQFMNIVLDECVAPLHQRAGNAGTVERLGSGIVIRGNSIITMEPQERVNYE